MASPALKSSMALADLDEMADKAREASEFLKALSHESRLLLLCTLAQGECSVGNLEEILGERQSTVSQQLARLRLDKLVKTRRDGKTIYYSLADENVRVLLEALHAIFCGPKTRKRSAPQR
jgi:DNA-binding transcriptional ArsR family regulator